jgi:hypothetical protein
MRLSCFAVRCSLLALAPLMSAQGLPPQPKVGAKVCVATVSNASTKPALVERLTERLTTSLRQNKIDAFSLHSATTSKYPLHLSTENWKEAKREECDYLLLSQIRNPREHPLDPQPPEISIGGPVPSVDASDPMGGSSGPVYRHNLQLAFALFRVGRFDPVLDTYLLERPSASVSESFLFAMDHEANRVSHELKKP